MERGGWGWATAVRAALRHATPGATAAGLAVWRRLPEWSEHAPEPAAGRCRPGVDWLWPLTEPDNHNQAVASNGDDAERSFRWSRMVAGVGLGVLAVLGVLAAAAMPAGANAVPNRAGGYHAALDPEPKPDVVTRVAADPASVKNIVLSPADEPVPHPALAR